MLACSVVVPAYNAGPWIAAALDSVLAQTAPAREVVVVDDGSTDETPAILARYGSHIRVVPGDHTGLSAARNRGLAAAHGDWIAFHDADDVALPDRLAILAAVLARRPELDAVFMNGVRMDDGRPVIRAAEVVRGGDVRLGFAHLFAGFPIYFQGALVRRRVFAATGPFDPGLRVQPDIGYAYRLLHHCHAAFVDRPVFRYRLHGANTSRDPFAMRVELAGILERVLREDAAAVAAIGRRRLTARIARHHFRIGRRYRERGDRAAARTAFARAVALRPLDLRYRAAAWRAGA